MMMRILFLVVIGLSIITALPLSPLSINTTIESPTEALTTVSPTTITVTVTPTETVISTTIDSITTTEPPTTVAPTTVTPTSITPTTTTEPPTEPPTISATTVPSTLAPTTVAPTTVTPTTVAPTTATVTPTTETATTTLAPTTAVPATVTPTADTSTAVPATVTPTTIPPTTLPPLLSSSTGSASPSSTGTSITIRYTFTVYFKFPKSVNVNTIIIQLTLDLARVLGCSPSIILVTFINTKKSKSTHIMHTLATTENHSVEITFQSSSTADSNQVIQAANAFRTEFTKAQDNNNKASIFSMDTDSLLSALDTSQGMMETTGEPYETILCGDGTQRISCETAAGTSNSESSTNIRTIIIGTVAGVVGITIITMLVIFGICRYHNHKVIKNFHGTELHTITMEIEPKRIPYVRKVSARNSI